MRLVRFEDESGGFAVDLHPLITVISGLPAHVRDRLVHGFAALPRGTDPGGRGAVEVHGVYLDLNRESLELLELNQDLDVVLRPTDLPGAEQMAAGAVEETGGVDLDDAGDDDEIREAKRTVQRHDDAYDDAVRNVDMYRARLEQLAREQQALAQELSEARTGLDSFAAAGLKVAREELAEIEAVEGEAVDADAFQADVFDEPTGDPVDLPEPTAAEVHEPELDRLAEPADTYDVDAERARIESRLSDLIDESDRLRRLIRGWRGIDPEPVRAAYLATGGEAEPESVASPEALELAGHWEALLAELDELGPVRDERGELLAALTSQRDAAYDAMKLAERNLRQPELDPSAVDRLETIHDEIFELDGKTSRFGGGKIRRRLETLRAEETELLGRLGFDTWSSYIMGITSAGSDPERRRDHERAVRAYELAEDELAHAAAEPPAVDVDPRRVQLDDVRTELLQLTTELLGAEPVDPVAELRAFRIEVVATSTSTPDVGSAAALRQALEDTGADIGDRDLDATELRALAAGWLETMGVLPERIADATAQRDEIEAEISELAVELEALPAAGTVAAAPTPAPAPAPRPTPAPEPAPAVEREPVATLERTESEEHREAALRVIEGEARVEAHEAAVARIADIEQRHQSVAEEHRDTERALAEREPAVAALLEQRVAARNRLRRAETNRSSLEAARWENRHHNTDESRYLDGSANAEAVEWYVLARLAQQRSVSFVGSVPLVIDDAFANWPVEALGDVFTRLERMGEVIQIVYLTDDPEVGAWARGLGADRALVLDMRVAS